eukprot:5729117-Pleurochrysis_carterae.AAC.1
MRAQLSRHLLEKEHAVRSHVGHRPCEGLPDGHHVGLHLTTVKRLGENSAGWRAVGESGKQMEESAGGSPRRQQGSYVQIYLTHIPNAGLRLVGGKEACTILHEPALHEPATLVMKYPQYITSIWKRSCKHVEVRARCKADDLLCQYYFR